MEGGGSDNQGWYPVTRKQYRGRGERSETPDRGGRGRGGREPLGPRGSRGMWEDQSRRIWKGSHPTSGSEFTRDVERLQPGRLTRPGGTGAGDPCDSMLAAPPPYNPFSASDFPALPLNPLLPSQPNHLHQAASIRLTSRDASQQPTPPSRIDNISSQALSVVTSKNPMVPSGPSKRGGALSIADFLHLKPGLKLEKQAPLSNTDKVGGRLKTSSAQGPSQPLLNLGPREGDKKGTKPYEDGLPRTHRGKSAMGPKKKKLTSLKKKILMDRLEEYTRKNLMAGATRTQESVDEEPRYLEGGGKNFVVAAEATDSICLHYYVTPECLEDDDEVEEIRSNVLELCSLYGTVTYVNIPRPPKPEAGLIIVGYTGPEEARAALLELSARVVGGEPLRITLYPRRREDLETLQHSSTHASHDVHDIKGQEGIVPPPAESRLICIRSFVALEDMEEEDEYEEIVDNVRMICSAFGTVASLKVVREGTVEGLFDVATVGDAIIEYSLPQDAAQAIAGLSNIVIQGEKLGVTFFHPKIYEQVIEEPSKKRAWVYLSDFVDVEMLFDNDEYEQVTSDLEDLCTSYGSVVSILIPRNQQGAMRDGVAVGSAAVMFNDPHMASNAYDGLSRKVIQGQSLKVELWGGKEDLNKALVAIGSQAFPMQDPISVKEGGSWDSWHPLQTHGMTLVEPLNYSVSDASLPGALTIDSKDGDNIGVGSMSASLTVGQAKSQLSASAPRFVPKVSMDSADPASRDMRPSKSRSPTANEESADIKGKTLSMAPKEAPKRIFPGKYAEAATAPKLREEIDQRHEDVFVCPPELEEKIRELVGALMQFQERARLKEAAKAKKARRMVFGLREVIRGIRTKKIKFIILAPNVEKSAALESEIAEIHSSASEAEEPIPILYAMSGRRLGKCLGKNVKITVIGIQSADGAYDTFQELVRLSDPVCQRQKLEYLRNQALKDGNAMGRSPSHEGSQSSGGGGGNLKSG